MIKITIEVWPRGFETNKRTVATAIIANDISGTKTNGNYWAKLYKRRKAPWKEVKITGFPRQKLSVWELLYRILKEAELEG